MPLRSSRSKPLRTCFDFRDNVFCAVAGAHDKFWIGRTIIKGKDIHRRSANEYSRDG